MTVRPAMCWSSTSKPCAKELCDALAKACHQHLQSEAVRGKVMESIESELLEILKDWAKKGDSVGKTLTPYSLHVFKCGYTHTNLISTSELLWDSPG